MDQRRGLNIQVQVIRNGLIHLSYFLIQPAHRGEETNIPHNRLRFLSVQVWLTLTIQRRWKLVYLLIV